MITALCDRILRCDWSCTVQSGATSFADLLRNGVWPRETMPTNAFLQPARAAAICTAPSHLPLFVSNEKGEKWSNQCQPRFFYSQPASATAICMAPRAETRTLPPVLPFLLAQNLSSKQIAPSDNWRPSCTMSTLISG